MALRIACDGECEQENLTREKVVQVSVQVIDPESGTRQVKKDFCLQEGDKVVSALGDLGFEVE